MRAGSIPEPEAPPEALSCSSFGRGCQVPAAGQHEPHDQPGDVGRGGGGARDQLQHRQGQRRGDDRAAEQAPGTAAADPGRELRHRRQRMPRQRAGQRVVGGDGGQRPGGRLGISFGLLEQVGVGLAAAPAGAQLGVGGGGGGVAGQVPAVRAVRVGGRGDGAPGGPDGLIVQVGAGGQAERLERIRASPGGSGAEQVIQAGRVRPGSRAGAGSRRGSGTRGGGGRGRRAAGAG